MKILVIGGNRFVGLRVSSALDKRTDVELHIFNRTGLVRNIHEAVVHKGNHDALESSTLDREYDVVIDFACFTAEQARESVNFFHRVGRYILISTASVYDPGPARPEGAFDPRHWPIHAEPTAPEKENLYQFGKRQAEAIFAQQAKFPSVFVRFPFIVGSDDYTHRMSFHHDRVRDGKMIYLPTPQARVSFVQSEDAAHFLLWVIDQTFTGPVNVASPESIALADLLQLISKVTGRKPLIAKEESDSNHSPYGVDEDASLAVGLVEKLGYKPKSLMSWLPELLRSMGSGPDPRSRLH